MLSQQWGRIARLVQLLRMRVVRFAGGRVACGRVGRAPWAKKTWEYYKASKSVHECADRASFWYHALKVR